MLTEYPVHDTSRLGRSSINVIIPKNSWATKNAIARGKYLQIVPPSREGYLKLRFIGSCEKFNTTVTQS